MPIVPQYRADAEAILSHIHDNGGELWATPDKRLLKGAPFTTLTALNAFRFTPYCSGEPALDRAVEFLLRHWVVRAPISPCHYGIGTLFLQAEYPFRGYNLFPYVHTLSFYGRAKSDPRFLEALSALEAKLADGQMVVERVVPKLAKLSFCKRGAPSAPATRRYREILANLGRAPS